MSPFQHGEVFVTEDGAETDLDLGHYERFTDANTSRALERHRRRRSTTRSSAASAAATTSAAPSRSIPHITDEIKQRIRLIAESSDVDVVITEIGGTVGDIESLPFLEAIRQFPVDVGRGALHVHPPHARALHRPRGRAEDQADAALGQRAAPHRHPARHGHLPLRGRPARSDIRRKIALFASLPEEAIVSARDVDNIYKVPLVFRAEGVDDFVLEHFGIEAAAARPRGLGGARRAARDEADAHRCGSRSSASTSSSRTPTCRWSRRCATRASCTAAGSRSTGSTPRRSTTAEAPAPARGRRRHPHPRRLRRARHRGQDRAPRASRASSAIPYPRHLPRHADRGLRVRAPRRRHGRRELDRVRPRDARSR